jgi:hypothetical protein
LYDLWGDAHSIYLLAVVAFRKQIERFTAGQVNSLGSQGIFSTTVIEFGVLAEISGRHLAAYLSWGPAFVVPLQGAILKT